MKLITMFVNNNSVCINSSIPESTLKNNHKSISYHAFHLGSDAKYSRVFFG